MLPGKMHDVSGGGGRGCCLDNCMMQVCVGVRGGGCVCEGGGVMLPGKLFFCR